MGKGLGKKGGGGTVNMVKADHLNGGEVYVRVTEMKEQRED